MEKINLEIDFHDPNLYVVGGSVIAVLTICMYYICNHKCSENTESEIELTSSQDNLQNFKDKYLHNREATLPAWFQYEKGLNLLKNCRNKEAFSLLLEVLNSKICLRKKFISFLLIIYSGCKILINKVQKFIL